MAEGQRPTKRGVVAEARGHLLIAQVSDQRRHRKRRAVEREVHVQLKGKRIQPQGSVIGLQSENRAGGTGVNDLESAGTREAVPRQTIKRRIDAVGAARERADDWKENRGAPGPHRRIAIPQ